MLSQTKFDPGQKHLERAIMRCGIARCFFFFPVKIVCTSWSARNVLSPWEYFYPVGSPDIVDYPLGYPMGSRGMFRWDCPWEFLWDSHELPWVRPTEVQMGYPMRLPMAIFMESHGEKTWNTFGFHGIYSMGPHRISTESHRNPSNMNRCMRSVQNDVG